MRTRVIVTVLLTIVVGYAALSIRHDLSDFRAMSEELRGFVTDASNEIRELRKRMTSVTTSWETQGGESISVTTTKKDNETDDEWAARHQAEVAALQKVFPPV